MTVFKMFKKLSPTKTLKTTITRQNAPKTSYAMLAWQIKIGETRTPPCYGMPLLRQRKNEWRYTWT